MEIRGIKLEVGQIWEINWDTSNNGFYVGEIIGFTGPHTVLALVPKTISGCRAAESFYKDIVLPLPKCKLLQHQVGHFNRELFKTLQLGLTW